MNIDTQQGPASHAWLPSNERWTATTDQYRSTAWSTKFEAINVVSGCKHPWHTAGPTPSKDNHLTMAQ
jgi:hypothetical protein